MNRKRKKLLSTVLAGLLCFAMLSTSFPPSAFAATQAEVDELAVQRDELAKKRKEVQATIDELEEKKADALELKMALDERTQYNEEQMHLNEQEIALYDQMIEDKAKDVDAAKALEDEQLEHYRVRVRAMEENGSYDFLALLLNTTSLGALLTTMDDIGEIMESDRELEDAYIAAREHTEAVKAEYEEYKAGLEEKQNELREEQEQLQKEIDEALAYVEEIKAEILENEELAETLRKQQEEVQRGINELVAELEAERKRREEEERRRREEEERAQQTGGGGSGGTEGTGGGSTGGGTVGTGSWGWPCPSSTYITSRAGNRFHPIFQEWRYHSGIDIAANSGAAVLASDSGTVCLCGVNGGYGNCIMIDHGNGYYTLYAHLSGYATSYGASVSKGATIGYVGSTGWATGPHLHFEVRNGTVAIADIEGFCGFSGLTYAPDAGE